MGTPDPQTQADAPHTNPVFRGDRHDTGNHVCRAGVRMTRPKPKLTGIWLHIAAACTLIACIALVMMGKIGD